jgi:type II secretory ATPase GspE/PulE/Tfp pilus assembly ATPase PilB-like protein
VRRICGDCKQPLLDEAARNLILRLRPDVQDVTLYGGSGCSKCRGTGYRGRLGLFELLVMDNRCREIVQMRGNASQIRDAALAAGMTLLRDDGFSRALQGETTIEEILRVARSED